LAPVWEAARVKLHDELKERGRGAGEARQSRARGLLVVSEVALSLVLLAGAGLLVKSFLRLQAVNPGFEAKNVLVIRLSLPKAQYPNRAAAAAFHDTLRPRLESLPGVQTVGVVSALPLSGVSARIPFTIEGRATAPDEALWADYRLVSTGYFRALKIPVLAGRAFDEHDTAQAA